MINLSAAGDDLVRPSTAAAASTMEASPADATQSPGRVLDRAACEPALAAVRAELEEHGALLNLLDRQQTAIFDRAWETLQTVDHMIAAQQQILRARCHQRRKAVAALAPEQPLRTLADLSGLVPPAMRPLTDALNAESSRLKKLAARRVQHNERMLARARGLAMRT